MASAFQAPGLESTLAGQLCEVWPALAYEHGEGMGCAHTISHREKTGPLSCRPEQYLARREKRAIRSGGGLNPISADRTVRPTQGSGDPVGLAKLVQTSVPTEALEQKR